MPQVWLCTDSLRKRLGASPLLLQLPIGTPDTHFFGMCFFVIENGKCDFIHMGNIRHFCNYITGIVDLVNLRWYSFDDQNNGRTVHEKPLSPGVTEIYIYMV